ncbi:peptidase inhibitor family I36 protein [Streptomyces sp. HNM0663]|uniref:Peptidase inhibitor family I36 protein n=1 Tax=Streptomyces chengmaiensis TaxID=3040919 RepID=A0ABT6HKR6_9ACTN|nr:peptidase inhibitor family I36 protein [Streptomyces chengmaiensis]MDH2389324.1 peptidase inhibitor family I36 protein [Streptomyces chengmaiensis]
MTATATATATAAFAVLAATAAALLSAPAATAAASGAPADLGPCGPGQLCLWPEDDFQGPRQTFELADTDIESCIRLPAGAAAQSLANRTGRPVTTYQSGECAETGEFETYPGSGTWAPRSPYRVRAFKLWES